jgi:hypothetical protein
MSTHVHKSIGIVTAQFVTVCLILSSLAPVHAESIVKDVKLPAGYQRLEYNESSYQSFIESLPLKRKGAVAKTWDDEEADQWQGEYRVLNMEFLFDEDLEQCADIAYRLFAEYHYSRGNHDKIEFRLQNGQLLSWDNWRSGRRLRYDAVLDSHVVQIAPADSDRDSFRDFLRYLFYWSGSWAVRKFVPAVDADGLTPGDMIVQNETGGPGHLSIIFGVCENEQRERLYLIGNGWTPAQDVILHKPNESEGIGYWFTIDGYRKHLSAFDFGPFRFRRF